MGNHTREVRTADDNCNNYFYHDEAHRIEGDKHRQEVVFDKGGFAAGLPKTTTSPTINPPARQSKRNALERLTDEFLRSGRVITICPPGKRPNFKFGKFKPPSASRGMPSAGDLSRPQWSGPLPDKREERVLIRKAKSGNESAKQKLVQSFHRFVLKIVSQYSGPPHNDLMAAGLLGLCEAIGRFNENRGYRLSGYAEHWIRKHARLCIKDWRKEGAGGETRQDRYVFSNPNATAEQVVAAVGGSLSDADKAIARLDAGHEVYDTGEAAFDEDGNFKGPLIAPSHEMSRMYGCLSRFQLSPQLRIHEQICGPHRNGRLGWVDELADYHVAESQRRLAEVGRRQYAVELVERERIRIGYRAKPSRYLYRKGSALKDYASRATQTNLPSVADTWATLCQEKNDRAQKLKEVAANHKTIQNHDPYKHLRPPKLDAGRKLKSGGERIWHDTRTTIPEKSLPLPCRPPLQVRHGSFVKKNFSVSATFAELHCSAI